ncbi:hypothetical protein L228DRAFT_241624 [Xylona heveae TC161]|uniref:mRNA decay factor PAT1 domain-containing protein n=1 Tax=Xylona heveae (strain CBS 132557 / TC161) TaxID=1328760 RepID=A0A164ZQN1_XYLHT|nr:hypothetical protein L228DRAFT_241624 [Xylona heveae TC161]KZF19385.1 hypothetical protein L228DRAFT_241624 [Xylona heveae TC161]
MSFFGFDTTLPRDRGHPREAPGFGEAPDPFAGFSHRGGAGGDDEALEFEDTYDGLGDQLDETDDTFNDDTFGSSGLEAPAVGKDFDFFGQTAKVSDAIHEEQLRYTRHQPAPKFAQPKAPKRTGYEKYQIPDLQASADLWGVGSKQQAPETIQQQTFIAPPTQTSAAQALPKKIMSLEEVEAAMRTQKPKPKAAQAPAPVPPSYPPFSVAQAQALAQATAPPQQQSIPAALQAQVSNVAGFPVKPPAPNQVGVDPRFSQPTPTDVPNFAAHPPQILQRPQPIPAQFSGHRGSPQPRQILQNPNRQPVQPAPYPRQFGSPAAAGGFPGAPVITNPQQLLQLSEEERAAFLIEDAKRAKRNHKIFLLSKDNGLMTPQDKNFITRIQLQQLVTATGGLNEPGSDAALSEDFYYQVHNQIRGGPRQNPNQPLGHFAQTYLFQTGGRHGGPGGRRHHRGGDNHMQRMEQQVQRAVEAAKLKPKNKQLVIEGSLGKISFSNAKTPKPLLNIKRQESSDASSRVNADKKSINVSANDRKSILRGIESVYSTLMKLEDHERQMPPPPTEESDAASVQEHLEWRREMVDLNQTLWKELKVMEPIVPKLSSPTPHPFIAFLSHGKGKKAIPRIFRHLDQEQRVTVLTMVVVHLDVLDVVRGAHLQPNEQQLPVAVREEVELFCQAVMPCLFGYVNEAPLSIVTGLLGLVIDGVNIQSVAYTKVGVGILTMLISRAELVKQAGNVNEQEWEQWTVLYNRLFDIIEPVLGSIFPVSVHSSEDMYVWQFLAAAGIGASPEQQQRLVIAVKDRVLDTVLQSKTLPADMASQRLSNVNLFMRAIGLDVELLG